MKPEVRRAVGRGLCAGSGLQGRLALARGRSGEHDTAADRHCVRAAAISIWRLATPAVQLRGGGLRGGGSELPPPLGCTAYQSARRLDPGPPIRRMGA